MTTMTIESRDEVVPDAVEAVVEAANENVEGIDDAPQPIPVDDLTYSEMQEFARCLLEDDASDVFDALSAALAAEKVDEIVRRVRNREAVRDILERLSSAIQMLTWVGSTLGVSHPDGTPVVPDRDFSKYSKQSLASITSHIRTRISQLEAEAESFTTERKTLTEANAALQRQVDDLRAKIEAQASMFAAQMEDKTERIRETNETLTSLRDVERFYVVRVNPETKDVVSFLRIEDGKPRGVKEFSDASWFSSFDSANARRNRIINARLQELDDRMKKAVRVSEDGDISLTWKQHFRGKTVRASVRKTYVVMRVVLQPVTLSDV